MLKQYEETVDGTLTWLSSEANIFLATHIDAGSHLENVQQLAEDHRGFGDVVKVRSILDL